MVISLKAEYFKEGIEIHLSLTCLCVDDLQYFPCFILETEGGDGSGKFFDGDTPTFIVIEDVEALFEFEDVVSW